ncbi:hypothetical protein J004_06533 [Cryptococcus neoformans]|nr:hypothetical protein J004_06533 [Cryptococcus neoformans var. grubii]
MQGRFVSNNVIAIAIPLFLPKQSDALYKARGFSDPAVAKQRINEAIEQIAEKRGISMAQVALAWSLSKEYITAPIVGTTSLDKLKDLLGAINLKLTQEEKKAIEEHYVPQDVTGHQ